MYSARNPVAQPNPIIVEPPAQVVPAIVPTISEPEVLPPGISAPSQPGGTKSINFTMNTLKGLETNKGLKLFENPNRTT
jgi:hypothetical protein